MTTPMTVVKHLQVSDFRNYRTLSLDDLGPLSILVGPNGAGKTNLIEAVQMICAGPSFRHATFSQMIMQQAEANETKGDGNDPAAAIEAQLIDGPREFDVALRLQPQSRRYLVNGNKRRPADVRKLIATVTFTPDDLSLAKGSMSLRRSALDSLGSRLSENYHRVASDYTRVLRHKNHLLRDEATPAMIDAIDELIITCGAQLTCLRLTLLSRLAPSFIQRYRSITDETETLDVRYLTSWDGPNAAPLTFSSDDGRFDALLGRDEARTLIAAAIARHRDEEIQRRRALIGPHADSIEFLIDGRPAQIYASQGQQRTLVLAYKLGEALTIESVREAKPVLLLDDVMSELDERRRGALVSYLESGAQTFITTTNLDYFDPTLVETARIISIEAGRLCNR